MKEKILERNYEIEKSKEIISDDKEKQILKQIEIFNSLYDCLPREEGLKLYMLINYYKEKTEESNKEWFKKGFMMPYHYLVKILDYRLIEAFLLFISC